jgi:hypothetical protein
MKLVFAILLLVTCGAMVSTAQDAANVLARVDHLVYATPDLAVGIDRLENQLGVRATPGGQHPGRGTRNALIAIGPRAYIEIIGPDPDQPEPAERRPFGIDALTAPRLVTWSANAKDLAGLSQRAVAAGVALGELADGSRRRPDGVLLAWRYTNPRTVVADGVVPFFIDWGSTPHPAASAAAGGRLVGLRAEHPEASRVAKQLGALGLTLAVTQGPMPALIATIDSPRGRVELR